MEARLPPSKVGFGQVRTGPPGRTTRSEASGAFSGLPELFADRAELGDRPSPRARFAERMRARIPGVAARLGLEDDRLRGRTFEQVVEDVFLRNPRVSERILRQASATRLEDLTSSEKVRQRVGRCCPDHRDSEAHRFAAGVVAVLTGLDPTEVSDAAPDLGLLGSVRLNLYTRPRSERSQLNTALHDATDFLKSAGVEGLNRAVWGAESTFGSAIRSFFGAPRTE
ncbi:MAG TPA: hypothetical protein RMG48_19015 [Myxococcales bacterium LLY-WYZ-16_1]|jgi:hypothetical protein|nr:hypothetical protein [Myxococcales bacterium LLY-WYZ-16_1]